MRRTGGSEVEPGPGPALDDATAAMATDARQPALDRFAEAVARLLEVPVVLVTSVDGDGQRLRGGCGLASELEAARLTLGVSPFCRRVLDSGRPVIVHDTRRHSMREHDVLGAVGYAGFPLAVDGGGAADGVLSALDQPGRRWRACDIEVLRALGPLGAALLGLLPDGDADTASLRRTAELVSLSVHDDLTGLLNRRGFHVVAEQQLALARRRELPGMLLFLDLDGLKATNDRAGHAAGDELLRAAAAVLSATFREADTVGRLGGDELAVLMVDTVAPDGAAILVRLAGEVVRINRERDPAAPLSWSIGTVAFVAQGDSTLAALLAEGDRCMYDAKRARTRARPPPEPPAPPT